MPKCTVCHHPQLLEINQAILSKDFTLAVLSQKYGLHPSSLQRHKNHIEIKMSRSLRRLREIREQGSLLLLNDNPGAGPAQYRRRRRPGQLPRRLSGSHVASRHSTRWVAWKGICSRTPCTASSLLPPGSPPASCPPIPASLPACIQGPGSRGLAPCPEPPPEVSAQAAGEADDRDLAEPLLESGNSELETGPPPSAGSSRTWT